MKPDPLSSYQAAWPDLEILGALGRGAMGLVLLATQRSLDRRVAVKVLLFEDALPEDVQRFEREARSYAALSHPNLVRIYDASLEGPIPRMLLEYVEGPTLSQLLREGAALPVLPLARELAGALAYLHERSFAHRDVKPANIMLRPDGSTVLMDMGLAKAPDRVGPSLTAAGFVVGTISYLAPEVFRGEQPGPAADVYSLGLVLYEVICRRPVFTGDAKIPPAVRAAGNIPPLEPGDGVSAALAALVMRCVAVAPDQRPGARELSVELVKMADGPGFATAALLPESAMDHGQLEEVQGAATGARAPAVARAAGAARGKRRRGSRRGLRQATLALVALAGLLGLGVVWLLQPPRKPVASPRSPSPVAATPPGTPSASSLPPTSRGGDGSWMVLVDAGTFRMGSNDGRPDERPEHVVHLSAFYIDRSEVTNQQYERFCAVTKRARRLVTGPEGHFLQNPEHPVVRVTWEDAAAYCAWAGKRLPTEAEWEKAARGARQTTHPWGRPRPDDPPRANVLDLSWANRPGGGPDELFRASSVNDGFPYSAPVETFPAGASAFGVLDMAGNVAEFCQDWYGERYYELSPDHDPSGPATGGLRVVRGGSWRDTLEETSSVRRDRFRVEKESITVGFRGVKPAVPNAPPR